MLEYSRYLYVLYMGQKGGAVGIQHYINNQNNTERVGLGSITYVIGWYNIETEQHFFWCGSGPDDEPTVTNILPF